MSKEIIGNDAGMFLICYILSGTLFRQQSVLFNRYDSRRLWYEIMRTARTSGNLRASRSAGGEKLNDEMKGKSGKVKVMYVRSDMILINVPTTRVPGKGAGVQEISC